MWFVEYRLMLARDCPRGNGTARMPTPSQFRTSRGCAAGGSVQDGQGCVQLSRTVETAEAICAGLVPWIVESAWPRPQPPLAPRQRSGVEDRRAYEAGLTVRAPQH